MTDHRRNTLKAIKWTGTILCLIGIALTSFNVYPLNVFLSLIGSALWAWAGWLQRDTPLVLVEGVAVTLYFIGVITWLMI
jgi:hypothetical protein